MTTAKNEVFIGLQQENFLFSEGVNLLWGRGSPLGQNEQPVEGLLHPPSTENPAPGRFLLCPLHAFIRFIEM